LDHSDRRGTSLRERIFFSAKRSGWIAILAALWLISFLIGLPIARKFSGMPFPLV
jgi:hypothetical protein